MRTAKGHWTCRVCKKLFHRPSDFHQRICDDCMAQTAVCACSQNCDVVIKRYKKDGKQRLYAIGHSPQERLARSKNGKKVWDVPGFREKISAIASDTIHRLWEDGDFVEMQRASMRRRSLGYWQNEEYRRMHEQMPGKVRARGSKARWERPDQHAEQSDLMRRMSLEWWADPDIRCAKLAHLDAIRPDATLGNNPNWRGGSSFYPYTPEFNNKLKDAIRARDGYACFICGLTESEQGRSLDVHHIDYDKGNSSLDNLVALCDVCHGRTDHNHAYWQDILNKAMENSKHSHA